MSGANLTAKAGDLEFERLWPNLKGISIKNYIGKLYYSIVTGITITQKIRGYLMIGDFKVEYLREF
jgi:hypothetical protein